MTAWIDEELAYVSYSAQKTQTDGNSQKGWVQRVLQDRREDGDVVEWPSTVRPRRGNLCKIARRQINKIRRINNA